MSNTSASPIILIVGTMSEIADLLHLSPETLTRCLQQYYRTMEGTVPQGQIFSINLSTLESFAETPIGEL